MLDFTKLVQQIELVRQDNLVDREVIADHLENARIAFDDAIANQPELLARLEASQTLTYWPLATLLEPLGTTAEVPSGQLNLTVVGVDGSQIMPSHHEVLSCYLLNIGVALVTYGGKFPPVLESLPSLYHKEEDLYPLVDRRRLHIDELYVSLERSVLELEWLARKAVQSKERALPVSALYDGSLIAWSLEKLPQGYQDAYLKRMTAALDALKDASIPLIGYISNSRSADLVNLLRVGICPYDVSDCREHCGDSNEEDFPCSKIWPLADRNLVLNRLSCGSRSAVFLSGASVSKLMPLRHRVCFTYLNVGEEVCRLEMPRWVFDDAKLLLLGLSSVMSQCQKGMGYPLVLSEAHHLAVIKGVDRDRFFELIARHLVEIGVTRVRPSPKQSKKRLGFV